MRVRRVIQSELCIGCFLSILWTNTDMCVAVMPSSLAHPPTVSARDDRATGRLAVIILLPLFTINLYSCCQSSFVKLQNSIM